MSGSRAFDHLRTCPLCEEHKVVETATHFECELRLKEQEEAAAREAEAPPPEEEKGKRKRKKKPEPACAFVLPAVLGIGLNEGLAEPRHDLRRDAAAVVTNPSTTFRVSLE